MTGNKLSQEDAQFLPEKTMLQSTLDKRDKMQSRIGTLFMLTAKLMFFH
jgi:hypothetical protein